VYWVTGGEEAMRTEIYVNGPIEAIFNVNEDFYTYKSGIVYNVLIFCQSSFV